MSKPIVIKIGGAILDEHYTQSDSPLNQLIRVIAQFNNQAVVIVHGGGCIVDEMLAQAGFSSEKKQGLRLTPKQQMPVIAGALAGNVNKAITACAVKANLAAVGLSLLDGDMVKCDLSSQGLGQVGVAKPYSSHLLDTLLKAGFLPVISSIGAIESGELVNVNADDAAVAICQLLNAELLLLTDVNGVKGAEGKYINQLDQQYAQQLIEQGIIAGGMVAKVNAAFHAANKLRRSIAVASWKSPEQIINLLDGDSIGTRILPCN